MPNYVEINMALVEYLRLIYELKWFIDWLDCLNAKVLINVAQYKHHECCISQSLNLRAKTWAVLKLCLQFSTYLNMEAGCLKFLSFLYVMLAIFFFCIVRNVFAFYKYICYKFQNILNLQAFAFFKFWHYKLTFDSFIWVWCF